MYYTRRRGIKDTHLKFNDILKDFLFSSTRAIEGVLAYDKVVQ